MAFIPTTFYTGDPNTSSGDTNLYTVPTGKTAIVTHWILSPTTNITPYLYLGGSSLGILAYNQIEGKPSPPALANTTTHFRGFYVVHAGESIQAGGNQIGGWQSVHGILCNATDTMGGRRPKRLGTVAPNDTGATYPLIANVYTVPSGKSAILKTYLVSNYSGSYPQYGFTINGFFSTEQNWVLDPGRTRQTNASHRLNSGDVVAVREESGIGGSMIRATLYGWEQV